MAVQLIRIADRTPLPPEIIKNIKEIKITGWQEIKSSRNSLLSDYIIELYNPDEKQGAEKIKYSIGDTKGETYLLPLQKKIIIASAERKNLHQENFKMEEVIMADFSKEESAELEIFEKKYVAEDKEVEGSSVSAAVSNKGKYDFSVVDIDIILYDMQKNPAAVLSSRVNMLLSGQEQNFKVFWPYFIKESIGEVFIQVSSNIIDRDNANAGR